MWSCDPVLPNVLVDLLDKYDREKKEKGGGLREDEFGFDDFSEWCSDNYSFEVHELLRCGSSEKFTLACYLPR